MTSETTTPGLDPGILAAAAAAMPASATAAPTSDAPTAAAAPVDRDAYWLDQARDIWRCAATIAIVYPSCERVYTEERVERLAQAWAPVLKKHDLDFGQFMMYFTAATTTLPVLAETYKACKHDNEATRAANEAAKAAGAVPAT